MMWVFLNEAFVSIVAHRDKSDTLLVRARFAGDLARLFPDRARQVKRTPAADYLFRVEVPRDDVALMLANAAHSVDYPNFKDSIGEHWRKADCSAVWSIMYRAQDREDERRALAVDRARNRAKNDGTLHRREADRALSDQLDAGIK